MLLKEFGQITIYPHGELLSITDLPATVKWISDTFNAVYLKQKID
jgi:hypothetical protein